MQTADFLIVGGGIAGVSAAARLAPHGRTLLLEAEDSFGYHSSGRSATYYHFGIGKSVVRGMTAFSRPHFETVGANGTALSRSSPALFIAPPEMLAGLDALEAEMRPYSDGLERLDADGVRGIVPVLRCGGDGIAAAVIDRTARRLDSEALQQDYRAAIKRAGGQSIAGARVVAVAREGASWVATTTAVPSRTISRHNPTASSIVPGPSSRPGRQWQWTSYCSRATTPGRAFATSASFGGRRRAANDVQRIAILSPQQSAFADRFTPLPTAAGPPSTRCPHSHRRRSRPAPASQSAPPACDRRNTRSPGSIHNRSRRVACR